MRSAVSGSTIEVFFSVEKIGKHSQKQTKEKLKTLRKLFHFNYVPKIKSISCSRFADASAAVAADAHR